MSDQSERKTLSLNPGTKKKASNAEPRVRSGARARAASLQQDRQGGPKRETRPYVEKRDQDRRERPAFNRDRADRPQSGERREFSGERRERPAFNRDRDSRPQSGERREFSGERREFSGERRERPAFNRDRDSRPQSGERREFSGERREFSGERRERPA
ncbi:DNA methyltransferase, partial [Alcaligenes faecalis]